MGAPAAYYMQARDSRWQHGTRARNKRLDREVEQAPWRDAFAQIANQDKNAQLRRIRVDTSGLSLSAPDSPSSPTTSYHFYKFDEMRWRMRSPR